MSDTPKVLPTVILLAPLVFSFAFAMDIYIPAVPAMTDIFHTTQANVQLTLSIFMLVSGIGQLFFGPLTDQYGRRLSILLSGLLFIAGSFLCVIAPSITWLIIARVIQAFGGCGLFVTTFAIVRDQFSGKDGAKVYSFLNCGIGMSPLFAPIIGSYLFHWFNWQAGFIFLTLMGIAILIIAMIKIKETHPLEKRVKIDTGVFLRYGRILTNRSFITYVFCASAGLMIFFVFFSSSPYIVMNLLHAAPQDFGYYFFAVGSTFFIGSLLSGKIAGAIGAYKTVVLGTLLMLMAGVLMLVWRYLAGVSAAEFLIPCMIAGIGGSFMMGAGVGGAMEPFGEIAGSAAAVAGCLEFLSSAILGSVIMHWPVRSTDPLSLTMIVLSFLALIGIGSYTRLKCGAQNRR